MLNSKIIVTYRIIAILILSIPMAINIYIKGDIVNSIIAVPLITLAFSAIAIFIDGKLENRLNHEELLSAVKMTPVKVYLERATCAWYVKSVRHNSNIVHAFRKATPHNKAYQG